MRVLVVFLLLICDCLFGPVIAMEWDIASGPIGIDSLVLVSERKYSILYRW
jgi:hypothetical protein